MVCADVEVDKNYETVKVREGESVDLVCSSEAETKVCSFVTPTGDFKSLFEGANYPRLKRIGEGLNDCGIQVR